MAVAVHGRPKPKPKPAPAPAPRAPATPSVPTPRPAPTRPQALPQAPAPTQAPRTVPSGFEAVPQTATPQTPPSRPSLDELRAFFPHSQRGNQAFEEFLRLNPWLLPQETEQELVVRQEQERVLAERQRADEEEQRLAGPSDSTGSEPSSGLSPVSGANTEAGKTALGILGAVTPGFPGIGVSPFGIVSGLGDMGERAGVTQPGVNVLGTFPAGSSFGDLGLPSGTVSMTAPVSGATPAFGGTPSQVSFSPAAQASPAFNIAQELSLLAGFSPAVSGAPQGGFEGIPGIPSTADPTTIAAAHLGFSPNAAPPGTIATLEGLMATNPGLTPAQAAKAFDLGRTNFAALPETAPPAPTTPVGPTEALAGPPAAPAEPDALGGPPAAPAEPDALGGPPAAPAEPDALGGPTDGSPAGGTPGVGDTADFGADFGGESGLGGDEGSDDGDDGGDAGDSEHEGGPVERRGPPGPESRSTLLEGEFVMNRGAVNKWGFELLSMMNDAGKEKGPSGFGKVGSRTHQGLDKIHSRVRGFASAGA